MASIVKIRDKDGNVIEIPAFKGSKGDPGKIKSVTATVDNTIGNPSVEVNLGGTEEERTIGFAFSGLKGQTGEANIVFSPTEPTNPVEGMIWLQP